MLIQLCAEVDRRARSRELFKAQEKELVRLYEVELAEHVTRREKRYKEVQDRYNLHPIGFNLFDRPRWRHWRQCQWASSEISIDDLRFRCTLRSQYQQALREVAVGIGFDCSLEEDVDIDSPL